MVLSGGFSGVGKGTEEDESGFPVCDFERGESKRRFFDLNGMDLEEPGALIFLLAKSMSVKLQRKREEARR